MGFNLSQITNEVLKVTFSDNSKSVVFDSTITATGSTDIYITTNPGELTYLEWAANKEDARLLIEVYQNEGWVDILNSIIRPDGAYTYPHTPFSINTRGSKFFNFIEYKTGNYKFELKRPLKFGEGGLRIRVSIPTEGTTFGISGTVVVSGDV